MEASRVLERRCQGARGCELWRGWVPRAVGGERWLSMARGQGTESSGFEFGMGEMLGYECHSAEGEEGAGRRRGIGVSGKWVLEIGM